MTNKKSDECIEVLPKFSCTLCDDQFSILKDIENHISTFHQITSKSYRKSLIQESKNF